jgi:hypothetical protein
MHIGFAPAAYHEPNQLDPENPIDPNQSNSNYSCERFMPLMTVSIAIMIVYTLQRLHNFTHMLVISSLAK